MRPGSHKTFLSFPSFHRAIDPTLRTRWAGELQLFISIVADILLPEEINIKRKYRVAGKYSPISIRGEYPAIDSNRYILPIREPRRLLATLHR